MLSGGDSYRARGPPAEPVVSLDWLHAHLNNPGVVVIATGDQDEFEAAHIAAAGFVPHHATLGEGHRLVPPAAAADVLARAGAADASHIVLYGDDPMSNGWLYMILASLGHGDHTSLLDGNIKAWQAARYPVVKGPATAAHGHLTVKTPPDRVVVDAPWVGIGLTIPESGSWMCARIKSGAAAYPAPCVSDGKNLYPMSCRPFEVPRGHPPAVRAGRRHGGRTAVT